MDELLTVAQVLKHLQISRATLYRQIAKGVLTPIKIGTITRFRAADLDALAHPSTQRADDAGTPDQS